VSAFLNLGKIKRNCMFEFKRIKKDLWYARFLPESFYIFDYKNPPQIDLVKLKYF